MVIKVYVSGICGSQEVRKLQQRVLFILQSLPIDLQVIDVTEPGKDEDLVFMQETAKKHDKKTQLPPQIFNDNDYCGDYADFELANDDDEIMKFLKLESGPSKAESLQSGEPAGETIIQNGFGNHENDKDASENMETNDKVESDLITEQKESNVLSNEDKTSDVEKSDITQNQEPNVEESEEESE